MDIDELRELPSVAERVAAAGRSKIKPPHCWFCNKVEAWFLCDCPEAREAQSDQAGKNGKRAKPRFDAKLGAMILDEDIIQRNLAWGHGRRYEPSPKSVNTQSPTSPAVNKSVNKKPNPPPPSVHAEPPVNIEVTVDAAELNAVEAARKAYRREWQRQRRAKLKAP